jgi:Zn-dependent protease with chaperone function
MTTMQAAGPRLPGISAKAYEHPADRAATSALRSIPLMDRLLKTLSELGLEKRHRQILLGNAVRLGTDQVPAVWDLHCDAAAALDIDPPLLYVTQTPVANALTIGARSPVVIVFSELVASYQPEEVHAVLAHELGHVLSEHTYYTGALYTLAQVLQGVSLIPLAGLPARGLYMALLEWARAAELSSDRAAAIAIGDPQIVCASLMRIAGGALPDMNLQAFLRQATEYTEEEDLFARHARFRDELTRPHPFAVRRVRELVGWVGTGEYDRIMAGSYVRRGEEPPMTQEFESAVAHYRERFNLMVERTAGGITKLTGQIQSWLSNLTDSGSRGGDEDQAGGESPGTS